MRAAVFTIGKLAAESGTNVQTIRYYEQIGLLPVPPRSQGNQRLYGPEQVRRLAFIRRSRDLGFSIERVRELLRLADTPDRPCEMVDDIAARQLVHVQEKIRALRALKRELQRLLDHDGGTIRDCRIVETLSRPTAAARKAAG